MRVLRQGVHYTCGTKTMRLSVHQRGKKLGRLIRTRIVDIVERDSDTGQERVVGEGLAIELTNLPYGSGRPGSTRARVAG